MGKNITSQQIKEAVTCLAYAGIKTTTFWVIGYPGETEDDFRQTLDLVELLKDNIYEADCNPFYYHLTGQVNSNRWQEESKAATLYPEWAKDMLISQTWRLEAEPPRDETMRRVNRFVQHCKRLNIPNPYSLEEVNRADLRWKKLHKNAVPPLLELRNKKIYIDECKQVTGLSFAANPMQETGEWL